MNVSVFSIILRLSGRWNLPIMLSGFGWLLSFPGISPAQVGPLDHRQPLYVEAGQCVFDVKNNQSRCQQGMQLRQGKLHIDADSGTVFRQGKRIVRIEMHGEPAIFRQILNPEDGTLEAKARYMDYRVIDEVLLLKGKVEVKNPNMGTFSGAEMTINLKKQEITGGGHDGDGRVHMVMESEVFSESPEQTDAGSHESRPAEVNKKPDGKATGSGHD